MKNELKEINDSLQQILKALQQLALALLNR